MSYGGPRSTVTASGSPFVYQNASPRREKVIVSGGTVTQIELSRDGAVFDSIGTLSGHCILNPKDTLRVTYLLAPTIAIYPL